MVAALLPTSDAGLVVAALVPTTAGLMFDGLPAAGCMTATRVIAAFTTATATTTASTSTTASTTAAPGALSHGLRWTEGD